jgi:hypothetical protein
LGFELDGQQFIDLMVEGAAPGEVPSSPVPPKAGARRARLYGVSSGADNRHHKTMLSSGWGAGIPASPSGRRRNRLKAVT